MVVAVIAVGMVQLPRDQVVDMIAVRNRLVTAARTMLVIGFMTRVAERRRAMVRILGAHLDRVLLDDVAVLMMQMTVMKVVDMVAMLNSDVAAAGTVPMRMVFVDVGHHDVPFLLKLSVSR